MSSLYKTRVSAYEQATIYYVPTSFTYYFYVFIESSALWVNWFYQRIRPARIQNQTLAIYRSSSKIRICFTSQYKSRNLVTTIVFFSYFSNLRQVAPNTTKFSIIIQVILL